MACSALVSAFYYQNQTGLCYCQILSCGPGGLSLPARGGLVDERTVVTWLFFNILLPTLMQISKVNLQLMTAVLSTQRFSLSEQK